MKSVFSKVVTIWLTIVLLLGAVVGINVLAAGEEVATVDYKNVSYDGQIQLVYYVKSSVADAADGSYVKLRFWFPGVVPESADAEGYEEKGSTVTSTIKGTEYSLFFSGGILPKMMREDVYACTVRYAANGDVLSTGELFKFSVQEYVELRLAAGSTDKQVELYMALLGYGAAVQEALDYKTDKLAGRGFYDFDSYTATEVSGAVSTKTFYYDPATETYSATATGVEGEITYVIKFVYGGKAVWDEDAGAFTMEKKHEIISIEGSDGSDSLTVAGVEYTAGDLIPWRTFLTQPQTDTGTGTRHFAGERPTITLNNPNTLTSTGDILYEFTADFTATRYSSGIGNLVYIHVVGSDGKTKALTGIQQGWSDKIYYNNLTTNSYPSNNTGYVTKSGETVTVRIVVAKAEEEGKVTVTLYANGVETTPITVDAFEFASVNFTMQDDGRDRNSTVTMTNVDFYKYVAPKAEVVAPSYEPNTNHLASTTAQGTLATVSIWGVDNGDGTMTYYKNADNGGTQYNITYTKGLSTVVNSNGSVTYFNEARITKLTDASGADVAYITHNGVNYGVGDLIPYRTFFVGTTADTGSSGNAHNIFPMSNNVFRKSATQVTASNMQVDPNLHMLFESEITMESDYKGEWAHGVFGISFVKGDGTGAGVGYSFCNYDGDLQIRTPGGSNKYPGVEFGDTFKLRIEIKASEEENKFYFNLYVNGVLQASELITFVIDNAGSHRVDITFSDDVVHRQNVVTFRNFKAIKYNIVKGADPSELEQNTTGLATAEKSSGTKDTTIYYNSTTGAYSYKAADGYAPYVVTWKNGFDVVIAPDGAVTYVKAAEIVSIKDADGAEVTLPYGGKTYGAGNLIPRNNWFLSSSFDQRFDGVRFFEANMTFISNRYADVIDATSDKVDTTLHYILETELTLNKLENDSVSAGIVQIINQTTSGGTGLNIIIGRNANDTIYINADGNTKTIDAKLGESFTYRMEVRKNGSAFDITIYVNGLAVIEYSTNNNLRTQIRFDGYNYAASRNHSVTFKNFRHIAWNVTDAAE